MPGKSVPGPRVLTMPQNSRFEAFSFLVTALILAAVMMTIAITAA